MTDHQTKDDGRWWVVCWASGKGELWTCYVPLSFDAAEHEFNRLCKSTSLHSMSGSYSYAQAMEEAKRRRTEKAQ